MNVTAGYTSGSSNVCVCVWVGGMFTQMGKDRFLFFSSLTLSLFLPLSFTDLRTMGRRRERRLLLARRATLLKYLVLQYINRVSKSREEKRIGRHSHDEQLSTSERATADLLCMAMIVVPHQRRIYSNFTGEPYIHIRSGTRPLTYAREKCRVENFGRHPAIHLGKERGKYLEMKKEWRRWWWNISKCKKTNISLHIYLLSLEMRGRSTTTRERERRRREREIYFISPPSLLSLSLSLSPR